MSRGAGFAGAACCFGLRPGLNATPRRFIFAVPFSFAAASLFFALVTAAFWARRDRVPLML
ncbi:MAG: hypothetical protein EBU97_07185 [Rhodobacteraceae bacterium]|nr:hypothetical protein [Paracoccaceae bacterium]